MRRVLFILILFNTLRGAIVLDRIAVIVGKHVIKESDINRDLRMTGFLNRAPLSFSTMDKRQSAERLVDQEIIRQEIISGGYQRPAESEANTLEAQLRKDRFGGSQTRLEDELTRYALTEKQLHDALLWQLTVLQFIDQRFRVGVIVTDEEIRAYYDQHAAELRRQYPSNGSFEALEPKIRSLLEGRQVNQNFEEWLKDARNRYQIDYKQGAFQ